MSKEQKNKTKINLTIRNYKNFDKENFILDLLAIDWEQTLELNKKSVNQSFNNFFQSINKLLDTYI